MDKIKFVKELENRTKLFSIDVIKMSSAIENTIENRVIKNQITKSSTSVGANYREANRSQSKADFKKKIKICLGEASETVYWLEIIDELKIYREPKFEYIKNEAKELLAIFTSINKKLSLD